MSPHPPNRPRSAWKVYGLADVLAFLEKSGSLSYDQLEPVMLAEPGFLESMDVCADEGHVEIVGDELRGGRYCLTGKGHRILAVARRCVGAA